MPSPAAALANRVLEREAWAQERLAAHAGRVFVVAVGPLSTAAAHRRLGRLEPRPRWPGSSRTSTLTLSPLAVPSFLANPDALGRVRRRRRRPRARGDAARTSRRRCRGSSSSVRGRAGPDRRPARRRRRAAAARLPRVRRPRRVGESVASYARDEAELVAGAGAPARFQRAHGGAGGRRVDALASRIDALAQRIDAADAGRSTPCRERRAASPRGYAAYRARRRSGRSSRRARTGARRSGRSAGVSRW